MTLSRIEYRNYVKQEIIGADERALNYLRLKHGQTLIDELEHELANEPQPDKPRQPRGTNVNALLAEHRNGALPSRHAPQTPRSPPSSTQAGNGQAPAREPANSPPADDDILF